MSHHLYQKIIWSKNVRAIVFCGFLMKSLKKHTLKIWKKSWVPFGSYLPNSTANPTHFHLNWAESAVLFSRQLPNGTHNFFSTFYFIKNPQTTIPLTFVTHIISSIGGVCLLVKTIKRNIQVTLSTVVLASLNCKTGF